MDRRIPLTTRVAIIARVSTADENHTIENKHRDLLVIAERQGCEFVATFTEEGISGLKSGTVFQILAFLLQGEGSCVGSERVIAARHGPGGPTPPFGQHPRSLGAEQPL